MRLRIFFLCFLCYYEFRTAYGYEIPPVNVEIVDNGFRVWIPDQPGITGVLYSFENDNMCLKTIDYINEKKNARWISEQLKTKLKEGDLLVITIMVEYQNTIHQRVQRVHIQKGYVQSQNDAEVIEKTISEGACSANNAPAPYKNNTQDKNGCVKPMTRVTVGEPPFKCASELLFEENFDGPKLNLSQWSHDVYIANHWDLSDEFVIFDNKKANIFIKDGHLNILPTINKSNSTIFLKERCTLTSCYPVTNVCQYSPNKSMPYLTPPPVYSAKIHTKNSFSFEYGKVEIRAKLPYGDWLFPYIMLQSNNESCENRHQFRITFAKKNDKNSRIRSGLVTYSKSTQTKLFERHGRMMVCHLVNTVDGFHKYTLVWKDEEIAIYIDDRKCVCWFNQDILKGPFHIVLGVSAGGHFEFTSDKTPWAAQSAKAAGQFGKSFKGCCEKITERCAKEKRKQICSNRWDHNALLKVDYVRVYSV